jgi:flagellar biosynthesis protein FliQ
MFSQTVQETLRRGLQDGLWLVAVVSVPLLVASFLVAVVTGVLQSATQIQDPIFSLVPKLLLVGLMAVLLGPGAVGLVVRFAHGMLMAIPSVH